jgi:hypothetical protein
MDAAIPPLPHTSSCRGYTSIFTTLRCVWGSVTWLSVRDDWGSSPGRSRDVFRLLLGAVSDACPKGLVCHHETSLCIAQTATHLLHARNVGSQMAERPGFDSRQRPPSRLSVGSTQFPIQSLEVKRPGREADHSPVSSGECAELNLHSAIRLHGVVLTATHSGEGTSSKDSTAPRRTVPLWSRVWRQTMSSTGTEHRGVVVAASCWEGLSSNLGPEDGDSYRRSPQLSSATWYLKVGHDHLLPRPSKVIIHGNDVIGAIDKTSLNKRR